MLQTPWTDWPLPTHRSTTATSHVPHIITTFSSIHFYLIDIVLEFYIESFYSPLGSHVGAQFLLLFCLLTLDLMMIAWRSKHVVNNNHLVTYVLITLYIVALTSIVIFYYYYSASWCIPSTINAVVRTQSTGDPQPVFLRVICRNVWSLQRQNNGQGQLFGRQCVARKNGYRVPTSELNKCAGLLVPLATPSQWKYRRPVMRKPYTVSGAVAQDESVYDLEESHFDEPFEGVKEWGGWHIPRLKMGDKRWTQFVVATGPHFDGPPRLNCRLPLTFNVFTLLN